MSVGVVACGALALHVRAIARRRGWDVVVHPVDALLHNRPERIPAAVRAELAALRDRVAAIGARPTPIIDRQYFHSVYFRPRAGVLFELASRDIGFDVDEPLEELGSGLMLPPQYEARREELEALLTPLENPRATA